MKTGRDTGYPMNVVEVVTFETRFILVESEFDQFWLSENDTIDRKEPSLHSWSEPVALESV